MLDSSFAISPGNVTDLEKSNYKSIGALISYTFTKSSGLKIQCENGYVLISFYRDDIVRITMDSKEVPSQAGSFAVVKDPEPTNVSLTESNQELFLSSTKLYIIIKKNPLLLSIYDHKGRLLVEEADDVEY